MKKFMLLAVCVIVLCVVGVASAMEEREPGGRIYKTPLPYPLVTETQAPYPVVTNTPAEYPTATIDPYDPAHLPGNDIEHWHGEPTWTPPAP